MNWEKKGILFKPDSSLFWQHSHAALPTYFHLGGTDYRIYFTSRDKDNRTYVGFFEFDINDPLKIKNRSIEPVLSPGPWGFFDDHGVQACSVIKAGNGDVYMYYLGWNPGLKQPLFYTAIGLAISKDGGLTFEKYSPAPIMQRSEFDPWMVSGGTVMPFEKGYIMYYLSGFSFRFKDGMAESEYDVKIAHSSDGVNWERKGMVAFALEKDETNISRPSIIREGEKCLAWFPLKKRGMGYRCGFSESSDGLKWKRISDDVIPVSPTGWDNEAIDKMDVVKYDGRYYMLYNGNSFGKDGIGLAIGNI
jgi:predicted GH43/DUF377 family glycosyl hydrolase